MKKFIIAGIFCFAAGLVQAQEVASAPKLDEKTAEMLVLKSAEFDFGKIPQNKPVYTVFEWVNSSLKPLKLDNVSADCGCTTPEWDREAVAPGATGKVKVGYNAAAAGYFEKYITLVYNGNQTKRIKIKGTVWKAPEGSAPSNSSIQFLKNQIQ